MSGSRYVLPTQIPLPTANADPGAFLVTGEAQLWRNARRLACRRRTVSSECDRKVAAVGGPSLALRLISRTLAAGMLFTQPHNHRYLEE